MQKQLDIRIHSEIDPLEAVILHTPGPEVENMNPENAERALYSDILNLSVASEEYREFQQVLSQISITFEVFDLLKDVLEIPPARDSLILKIKQNEKTGEIGHRLESLKSEELANVLIQGLTKCDDTLTNFISKGRYNLKPLHNFFFTRDSAFVNGNSIFISSMASSVRSREALIMEMIFNHHPQFRKETIAYSDGINDPKNIRFEGGDVITARENVLIIGSGVRTSAQGIDFLIDQLKSDGKTKHILVQELPSEPESFIHLDMAFTLLDEDHCMVFEPLILKNNKFNTVKISVENKKVKKIEYVPNLIEGLKSVGMDLEPVFCGGSKDLWIQVREQWHSGANFFAVGPGKVMGYGRNVYTMDEMDKKGYEVIKASDIINNKTSLKDYKKYVIALEGSELARGGGGARCTTMPIARTTPAQ